jgi:hypothetical protein
VPSRSPLYHRGVRADVIFWWNEEAGRHAEAPASVRASRAITVDGRRHESPTAEDYENAFRMIGLLDAGVRLAERPDLVAAAQAH